MKNTYLSYDDISSVSLEISTFCNARCPMCSRHVFHKGENSVDTSIRYNGTEVFLDKDVLIKSFSEEFLDKVEELIFNGKLGEALLHPDFLEILLHIKSSPNPPVVKVYTNGSVKDDKFWKTLAGILNEKDAVVFSIDGLESTNSFYRQGTDWAHITKSFTRFISHGGVADWEYLVFEHNEHQVEAAREYASKVGFKKFIIRKTNRFKGKDRFEFKNIKGERSYLALPKDSQYIHDTHNDYLEKVKENYIIDCHFKNKNKIFVSHTGKVWPCSFISEYYPRLESEKEIVSLYGSQFNDLKYFSFREIMNHDFFKNDLAKSWLDSRKTFKECWKKCTRYNSNVTEVI